MCAMSLILWLCPLLGKGTTQLSKGEWENTQECGCRVRGLTPSYIHMNRVVGVVGAGLVAFLLVVAVPVYGETIQRYSLQNFVELLIERNIIPETMFDKARQLVAIINVIEPAEVTKPYANDITVSISQLIEHSFRRYAEGATIQGIILLAENTSTEDVFPTAVRNCQITYQIFEGDTMLYDSGTKRACREQELVSYRLGPGQTRMFEVRHTQLDYRLPRGEYRMHISYPGYGEGSKTFVVE